MEWVNKFTQHNDKRYYLMWKDPRASHYIHAYDFNEGKASYEDFRFLIPSKYINNAKEKDDYNIAIRTPEGTDIFKTKVENTWNPSSEHFREIIKYIFESEEIQKVKYG